MLYTTVQNGSSTTARVFGFLGPRGMRLQASEVVSLRGDLLANIGYMTQIGRNRPYDSMRRALQAGHLKILGRPAVVFFDATLAVPKTILIANNVISSPTVTSGSYA